MCTIKHLYIVLVSAMTQEGISTVLEEKQTIVAVEAGTITKRVYEDGRIERCDNVKDVAGYIERIDEMIERKKALLGDF